MIVQVELPSEEPDRLRRALSRLMCLVASVNARWARQGRLPALYRSTVRYRQEPPGPEMLDNARQVLARGWGDCDDLVCWRLGELWAAGEAGAEPRIVWRKGTRRYHAQVRRSNGSIEDPCMTQLRREKQKWAS